MGGGPGVDGSSGACCIAAPMRAPILAFALFAASACTQGNTQLPPFYDGSTGPASDSGEADGAGDTGTTGGDASVEAAADGAVQDGAAEGATGEGGIKDGGGEAGPTDSGGGG